MEQTAVIRILPRLWRALSKPWLIYTAVILLILTFFLLAMSTSTSSMSVDIKPRLSDALTPELRRTEQAINSKLSLSPPLSSSLNAENKIKTMYDLFLEKPVINHHDYTYLINEPSVCAGAAVHLVITTPSAPENFFRRMMVRRSDATANVKGVARHLFFIGASSDPAVQKKILSESRIHRDMIQEDYTDVYVNITLKAVQMLRWVSQTCPESKYVIRLDDDVSADVVTLLDTMKKAHERHENFVMGDVKRGWPPCQIPKCRTTKKEYPYATLPPFALGGALGYPTSSVIRLFEATKRVNRFKLDDVYVTGMCAPLVNVTLLQDARFVFNHNAW